MNHKPEHVALVRANPRVCKGPRVDADVRFVVGSAGYIESMLKGLDEKSAEERAQVNAEVARVQARVREIARREARAGCGYDFNETVIAGPFDGEEHEYKCPNCGLTGVYRAPHFDD